MSIESLRLKGFKSFGSPCEFTFTPPREGMAGQGFTAIVGPNGSGKSNILDALRWILGEGSNASLRIVRQSDLLFQGSISIPPAKEAEVSLTLSQPNAEQGSVLRRLYSAEAGSTLQVDGKKILVQELGGVKTRFALEGAGFAFIGQGEVSAAIHQTPKERRRHLDLLFGVERYRDRRDETLKRLETALSEVQRIQTLIQELEARRGEIAAEVEVAVQAQGILDNLDVLRRDFYFSRRFALEGEERQLRSKQQVLRAKLDHISRWQNLWRRAIQAGEEALRSQGFDESVFTEQADHLAERKAALQRQAFQAGTQIRTILDNRAAQREEIGKIQAQDVELGAELERVRSDEAQQRAQIEERQGALDARMRELEEGKAHFEQEQMRRQGLRDDLAECRLFISRAEAELRALSSSREADAGSLERLLEEQRQKVEAAAAQALRLKEEDERYAKLSSEHAAAYALCQKQAAALQQVRRERARQEAELDSLKDSVESSLYPEHVRVLLSASQLGKIHSRMEVAVEAFSCPPDIAPALEAYLGGRQFWLLVHTMEEAREGIELLKQRRGGRATFLPLENCRPRERDHRFKLPAKGVRGWGLDLIQVKAPWGPALAHMMGDLLIVETYPLGSALVKQGARFPIVTLGGEVFAPSGTVSGGEGRRRGSVLAVGQQIAELESNVADLKERALELQKALSAAEGKEEKLKAELDAMSGDRERVRAEAEAGQRALTALSASIERLSLENSEAKGREEALNWELDAAQRKAAGLEAELEALGDMGESPESDLAPLRSELSLWEERLRGTLAIKDRVSREREALTLRAAALEEEITVGRADEAERRDLLASIGKERLALHNEEQALRRRLAEEQSKVRQAHLRLERLRARSARSDAVVAERAAEIAAAKEREASLEAERHQLMEVWDEKYPYDAAEARQVEGGRDLTSSLRKLERELRALGPYNLGALSEDKSLTERVDFLTDQLADVHGGVEELRKLIQETDEQVERSFTGAMAEIDSRFNELFQRLFAGGEARLTLQDGDSIWDRGVEIYARPPGKKLQNISQLSGGEQSLTAIAQLFSALEVARVPLAVLDEVDAALDEYNLIRFADLAKEYSQRLQLIVMTHRRTTMERADLIYGVTMVEPGLTRIVGIDVENYR